MFRPLLLFVSSFFTVFFTTPFAMETLRKRGIIGIDVHKKERPEIPEMGGITIIFGLILASIFMCYFYPNKLTLVLSFLFTSIIVGLIGFVDDLITLNAKIKPLLTTLAGLPILIYGNYKVSIIFPVIGGTRLTKVYPLLIPLVIAVTSNAVNMMDPYNGVMAGSCSIMTFFLLISAIILGKTDAILLCACLLGSLLAFFYFNRYPSKVFSGDVGSLTVGAAIGSISILCGLEVVALVAFMPQIMNAFYGLSTIGKLYERRQVSRPTKVLENGKLAATKDPKAPLTLARFILARGPLYEKEVTIVFYFYSAISGVMAIITTYLLMWSI